MNDHEDLAQLLLSIEAAANDRGWDDPTSFIMALVRQPDGAIKVYPVTTKIGNPPGSFVEYLGQQLLSDTEFGTFTLGHINGNFLGFAFSGEGRTLKTKNAKHIETILENTDPDTDRLVAVETRQIIAVDISATVHLVHRERGQKPEYLATNQPGNDSGGQIPNGLRMMCLSVARAMPNGRQYVKLLENLSVAGPDLATRTLQKIRQHHDAMKENP